MQFTQTTISLEPTNMIRPLGFLLSTIVQAETSSPLRHLLSLIGFGYTHIRVLAFRPFSPSSPSSFLFLSFLFPVRRDNNSGLVNTTRRCISTRKTTSMCLASILPPPESEGSTNPYPVPQGTDPIKKPIVTRGRFRPLVRSIKSRSALFPLLPILR